MAGSHEARRSRLSGYRNLPEGRAVWASSSDSARRRIDSIKYRRGRRKEFYSRTDAVPGNRYGFFGRAGDGTRARCHAAVPARQPGYHQADTSRRSTLKRATRIYQKEDRDVMLRDMANRDMVHRDMVRRGQPLVSGFCSGRPITSRRTMSRGITSRSIMSRSIWRSETASDSRRHGPQTSRAHRARARRSPAVSPSAGRGPREKAPSARRRGSTARVT